MLYIVVSYTEFLAFNLGPAILLCTVTQRCEGGVTTLSADGQRDMKDFDEYLY